MDEAGEGAAVSDDLKGRRILIVDDDRDLTDTLALLLRAYGAEVYKAYSGAGAIDLFEQHVPELVLLDLAMPGMDGFEIAKRIHSCPRGEATPIVAVTGLNIKNYIEQSAESGIHFCMMKPFRVQALIDFIKVMLR